MKAGKQKANKPITVRGLDTDGRRISSKEFEELVQEAAAKSDTLLLETYGQHNVGGRFFGRDSMRVTVRGPVGQRLGGMGQPGTAIVCEGPASDDVGYLNIGADIVVLGDATNGVCNAMAQGRVMVRGSIGARGLNMTKWNPDYARPELWVLGSVGDSFAEFNCGGIAVVCGVEPKSKNVLGYRPCVGMVGGWVYYRGETDNTYSHTNVREMLPSDEQWQWLLDRLPDFLDKVGRKDLLKNLTTRADWKILVSVTPQERALMFAGPMPMHEFRTKIWEPSLGGDPLRDLAPGLDRSPIGCIVTGELRRRKPYWANQKAASQSAMSCPIRVPAEERLQLLQAGRGDEAYALLLKHMPFPASICGSICPELCNQVGGATPGEGSAATTDALRQAILKTQAPAPARKTGHRVAIIGGGISGMNTAWVLAQAGIEAHIFEQDKELGGKLARTIPQERLARAAWEEEVKRFMSYPGIRVSLGVTMTREKFANLKKEYAFIVVAAGTGEPRRLSFPGAEKVVPAADFLKTRGKGKTGRRVVIIGAGGMGCAAAVEAAKRGAKEVTLIDIREPLATAQEQAAAEAAGAKFRYPVAVSAVNDKGLLSSGGELFPADMVLLSIGSVPALDFLPENIATIRGWVKTDGAGRTSDDRILAAGDVERPGLPLATLASGMRSAEYIISTLTGKEFKPCAIPSADALRKLPAAAKGEEEEGCRGRGVCRDCHLCETICPAAAIARRELEIGGFEYVVDDDKCIACGFCRDSCPCGIWEMKPL